MGVVESISRVKFDYFNSLEANMFGVIREYSYGGVELSKRKRYFENKFLFRITGNMCGICTRNIYIGNVIYIVGSLTNTKEMKFNNIENKFNAFIDVDKIFLLD